MPSSFPLTRRLLIVGACLVFAIALGAAGWNAVAHRREAGCHASYERHIEALDDLRATGAIGDAEYDQRVKALNEAAGAATDFEGGGAAPCHP